MKTLCIGLVLAFTPACLGDDPDHLDQVTAASIQSPKVVVSGIPEALHQRLLSDIGTNLADASTNIALFRAERVNDFATTADAPELCQKCTVTLIHHMGSGDMNNPLTQTVTVYDDQANLTICALSLSLGANAKTVIRADTCGSYATESGPAAKQLPPSKG